MLTDRRRDGGVERGMGGLRERATQCIISYLLNIWTLPLHLPILGFFILFFCRWFLFVCTVLIEYVQGFEPYAECSQVQCFRNVFITIIIIII